MPDERKLILESAAWLAASRSDCKTAGHNNNIQYCILQYIIQRGMIPDTVPAQTSGKPTFIVHSGLPVANLGGLALRDGRRGLAAGWAAGWAGPHASNILHWFL